MPPFGSTAHSCTDPSRTAWAKRADERPHHRALPGPGRAGDQHMRAEQPQHPRLAVSPGAQTERLQIRLRLWSDGGDGRRERVAVLELQPQLTRAIDPNAATKGTEGVRKLADLRLILLGRLADQHAHLHRILVLIGEHLANLRQVLPVAEVHGQPAGHHRWLPLVAVDPEPSPTRHHDAAIRGRMNPSPPEQHRHSHEDWQHEPHQAAQPSQGDDAHQHAGADRMTSRQPRRATQQPKHVERDDGQQRWPKDRRHQPVVRGRVTHAGHPRAGGTHQAALSAD